MSYEVNEGDFGGAFDSYIDNRDDGGSSSSDDDTPEPTESQDRLFDGSNDGFDDSIEEPDDPDPEPTDSDGSDVEITEPDDYQTTSDEILNEPTTETDNPFELENDETTTHNGFTIERATENADTNQYVVKLGGQSIGKYGSLGSAESVAGSLDPDNYALGPGQTQEFQGFTLEGTGEGVKLLGDGELIGTYDTVATARSVARPKDIDNYIDSAMTGADPTQHGDTSDALNDDGTYDTGDDVAHRGADPTQHGDTSENLNDSGQYTDPTTDQPVNGDDASQSVRYFIQSGQTDGTDTNKLLTAGATAVGVIGALFGIASYFGSD